MDTEILHISKDRSPNDRVRFQRTGHPKMGWSLLLMVLLAEETDNIFIFVSNMCWRADFKEQKKRVKKKNMLRQAF